MHAAVAPFGLDHPADRRQRGLGGLVDREQRRGLAEHAPGGDVDDVPVAAFPHARRQAADQPQRCVVVERHGALDVVPALQRLGQRPADGLAGVVDQDVDPALGPDDIGDELVDGGHVGQVCRAGPGDAAPVGDACHEVVEQFGAPGHRDHRGAPAGELLGGGRPDPGRGAGDEHPLAAQLHRLAVGPVAEQLVGQWRPHARQQQFVGDPAQWIAAHVRSLGRPVGGAATPAVAAPAAPARSSAGTGSSPDRASPGRRRGPRPPRRSCTPAGWPHRRTPAGRPGRRRSG